MKDHQKAEDTAAVRVQWVAPLLAPGLDAARKRVLMAEVCAQTGLSERTVRRYLARYQASGFSGLKPKGKGTRTGSAIPEPLLEQATLLRREVPGRSIASIIQILEWEGHAQPGQIKRSTLQERLADLGYSSRQMRMVTQTGVAARRFAHPHRNQLWMGDIKFGPHLPIGPGGSQKQVYLVAMIDDATRLILHAEFYPTLDQVIVEDCFRQAVHKYGAPEATFFDNGKQYRTKWMTRTCSKLGIRLLYAKPYSAASKGKIERWNRTLDSFLAEVRLEPVKTLDALNARFSAWLSECYQNRPHSALPEETTPETAYRSDPQALRWVSPEVLKDAFLHAEKRRVDKSGCVSFQGQKYEVGLAFLGCTVEIVYDPQDISVITVDYDGHAPWTAKPLVIGTHVGKRPALPEHLGTVPAKRSRLLDAAAKRKEARQEKQVPAISYRTVMEEGPEDV